ncbi:MAG: helix-hairpin-helix domain-containing protein [Bacteroidales bacterium]|nr:helix-hairpin-helix domain-containing protein [Bacteroidales bacterium]
MNYKLLIILYILLLPLTAFAQDNSPDFLGEILTNAAEADDEDLAETAEMNCEYLEDISENKIDVNTNNINELQSIPIFNAIQIGDILEYRQRYGNIMSLGELKAIASLTTENIRQITHFISIGDSATSRRQITFREMLTKGRHYISTLNKMVLERQAAYVADSVGNTKYEGNRMRWCFKYRYKFEDRIAWGVTAEKDAGESLGFDKYKYGFDYYSLYLRISKLGIFDKIILGDYTVKFGQGLMLGGGFSMGKSMTGNNFTGCAQIREYGSVNENRFYRGAAATIKITKNLLLTTFASANLVDASCESTEFHSFKTDGYHRTARELANKDNLRETVGGAIAEYRCGKFQVGAAAYYYDYDKQFVPRTQLRYAQMYSNKEGVGASICYRYDSKKMSFYGETAADKHGNIATINAADIMPANNFMLRILQRHYSSKYQAFKALSFGQTSRASNEDGVYIGISAEPCKWFGAEAWADVFRLPWAGAYNRLPASGNEGMLQCKFRINRRYNLTIRLKHKERQNTDLDEGITKTGYLKVSNTYKPTDALSLTSAAQWSRCNTGEESKEHGYLIIQDFTWSLNGFPLILTARYALFSAPYSARIYVFESDVSGAFSSPGYFYEGQRIYLVAGCKIGNKATLQLKISQWQYFDRQTVGSGDSQIDGNKKSEISMFFKYNF